MSVLLRGLPLAAFVAVVLLAMPAAADRSPPVNAIPLSEILEAIEAEPGFRFFDEIEWDDGYYEIEYVTQDGTKRKIYIDPVTGQPR